MSARREPSCLSAGISIRRIRACSRRTRGPIQLFADIDIEESAGNSNYNSFQAKVQQRYKMGLTLLASYTFSKSIDDASRFFSTAGDPNFPQNSYNLRAECGLSDFDVRHRFSASYSYDLPIAKASRLWAGWQTFGIFTFQSGRPFTVMLNPDDDNANTGIGSLGYLANDRPNLIGNPKLSSPSPPSGSTRRRSLPLPTAASATPAGTFSMDPDSRRSTFPWSRTPGIAER